MTLDSNPNNLNPGLSASRKNSKIAVKNIDVSGTRLLGHPEGRRAVLVSDVLKGGIQKNHTPFVLVHKMLQRVALQDAQGILILFNLEILEVIFTEHPEVLGKITFIADSPLEQDFAQLVYRVRALYVKENSWNKKIAVGKVTKEIWRRLMKMNGAADITLTNPPYNGGLDLKILWAMHESELLRRVVCVHPAAWLVDVKTQLGPKTGNPLFRKFQDTVEPHLKSVEMFNGNPVFDIGLFVPCVITDMDFGWVRKFNSWIDVSYVEDAEATPHKVTGLREITLHGEAWQMCMKDFFLKMQGECATRGSLGGHYTVPSKVAAGVPTVQLAAVTGHWTASSTLKMVKDDFYTFVQKNPNANRGIRKHNDRMPAITLGSGKEVGNLIAYLQTDFARLCLALIKTSQRLESSDTRLVPWMDFSRSWSDDELFSEFGYPPGHPIRKYAKKFIPDYHNLYPNGKTY